MFGSYRELLSRAGAAQLTTLCVISWLSYCGYAFAMVLTVHAQTGSFGQAGTCTAGLSLGIGLFAPARGHWVEARGASAMRALCAAQVASGALLLVGVHFVGIALGLPAACVLGASSPPLIAVARSRWTEVAGPDLAATGHALFAAISDIAQLGGPALVGGVSAAISPTAGFAILIAGATTAGVLFSGRLPTDDRDAPPDAGRRPSAWRLLRASPGLQTLLLSGIGMSFWINGLELFATSLAARRGLAELGAIPIAASSLGGIVTSLAAGTRATKSQPARRYLAGLTLGAVIVPLTLLTTSVAQITAVFILTGAAFGLINVALYQLLDTVAPADRSITTFNILSTAAAAGGAAGASLTGRLVQTSLDTASIALIAVAAGTALLVLIRVRTLSKSAPNGPAIFGTQP